MTESGADTIRISLGHVDSYDERVAIFGRQLGLSTVQLHLPDNLPRDGGYWRTADLRALRERCEADGLRLEGLENVPVPWFDRVLRGRPGRDEQIENFGRTLQNMADAGIFLLGYNFMVNYVWRTSMAGLGRGGALVTAFDLADVPAGNALAAYKLTPDEPVDPPLTTDDVWAHHQYFLDAVLPVAEAAGVRLALHPDDPPVDVALGGAGRIFTSPAALIRGYEAAGGSPSWAINMCLGTISEMGGQPAAEQVIDFFGPRGAIAYVHFRDVVGTVPAFREGFLGEGNLDIPAIFRRLVEVGFDGFIIDDHVPAMIGDIDTWGDTSPEAYCSRARAHAIGYLQGVLDATLGLVSGSPRADRG